MEFNNVLQNRKIAKPSCGGLEIFSSSENLVFLGGSTNRKCFCIQIYSSDSTQLLLQCQDTGQSKKLSNDGN